MSQFDFHVLVSFFNIVTLVALVAGICFGYFLARYNHSRETANNSAAPAARKSCCS